DVRLAAHAWRMFKAAVDRRRAAAESESASEPADEPDERFYRLKGSSRLDLANSGIATVIWATGFSPSIGWLPDGALDEGMRPQPPGLHVIGAPWITHRSSANLYGMVADAARLVEEITDTSLAAAA